MLHFQLFLADGVCSDCGLSGKKSSDFLLHLKIP